MSDATQEQLVKDVIKTTLYVLAILLNFFLLYVIWRDPVKRFRNAPSYTIANLALADMVAAIGGLGACVDIFATLRSYAVHKVWACISTAGQQSSFLIISILAFDRYLAISHPYRYRKIFCQNHWSTILNISAWIIAWVISPTVHLLKIPLDKYSLVLYHMYVTNLSILALVTLTLYPLNYWSFLKAQKRHASPQRFRVKSMEDLRLAQQLNLTWMIVASFLLVAMVPYVYMLIISIQNCYSCMLNPIFVKFWAYYQVAFPATLCVNPLIYAWRLPLYRKALRALLTHLLKSTRQSATSSPPDSSDTITLSNKEKVRTSTLTQSLTTA